jgi:hypothetical protein
MPVVAPPALVEVGSETSFDAEHAPAASAPQPRTKAIAPNLRENMLLHYEPRRAAFQSASSGSSSNTASFCG